MALIDDIEFYGRAVDAEEMSIDAAVAALVETSGGRLTPVGAEQVIADWCHTRAKLERLRNDTVDMLRAARNGEPVPEHVKQHLREDAQQQLQFRPQTDQ
ncbi:hypothetical protein [Streptomyces botrytidirepellens]|uniref:Uncharacterized protein n=1 Tax=Streptomyces botrytidirepellens TaxID=2486417 RepID=A0A3M8WVS4_9ACTN|nr:hypothetical protein [Streptomyces botrytidirepellens]RNG33514.1 hypothetical protein EEJ42_07360 [Streptomyces botrytidirepellens]